MEGLHRVLVRVVRLVGAVARVALLMFLGVPAASAVTVDFESVPTPGCIDQGSLLTTQGFHLVADKALITCDSTVAGFADNGSIYLVGAREGFPGFGLSEASGPPGLGLPFSLLTFDGARALEDYPANSIRVLGRDSDGGVIADQTFALGANDGLGGDPDFETFVLSPAFSGLTYVTFVSLEQYPIAVDNLDLVVVPEPSSLPLAGPILGVLLLGSTLHRRRRAGTCAPGRGRALCGARGRGRVVGEPSAVSTPRLISVSLAALLTSAGMASAASELPPYGMFESDDGTELWMADAQVLGFKAFENSAVTGFSSFGFYFATDPDTLITIFGPEDEALASEATIDFNAGEVFDVDDAMVQSTFTDLGTAIGFWFDVGEPVGPLTIFTQSSLTVAGADSFSLPSSSDPNRYALAFSVPEGGDTPIAIEVVDGITPVPESSAALLFASGLVGLAVWRRRTAP
jgi:hypothetical protein